MSENRDQASQADAEMEATALAGLEAGIVTLTPDDLRAIRNVVVSAITNYPDVRAFLAGLVRAELAGAGVLTEANVYDSDALFKRLDETIYGTVNKVLDERGRGKE